MRVDTSVAKAGRFVPARRAPLAILSRHRQRRGAGAFRFCPSAMLAPRTMSGSHGAYAPSHARFTAKNKHRMSCGQPGAVRCGNHGNGGAYDARFQRRSWRHRWSGRPGVSAWHPGGGEGGGDLQPRWRGVPLHDTGTAQVVVTTEQAPASACRPPRAPWWWAWWPLNRGRPLRVAPSLSVGLPL